VRTTFTPEAAARILETRKKRRDWWVQAKERGYYSRKKGVG
jgi:hypothetical protein